MTLEQLLIRSGVSKWHRHVLFTTAIYLPPCLYIPDTQLAAMIARCYVPVFASHGVQVQVVAGSPPGQSPAAPPTKAKALIKKAYRGKVQWIQEDLL